MDEATILAITSDYDDDDLEAAEQVLQQIAESARAEEASGFDPSGLQGRQGDQAEESAASVVAETITTTSESLGLQSVDSDGATAATWTSARSEACLSL